MIFLRGNKVTTSISAALSCPKKTFLMNFPSRNTSTKAWMYNTWWHKHNCGLTAVKTPRYLFCWVRGKKKQKNAFLLFVCGYTYCHAGATLGEVDHRGIELVLEEVSMGHHSPSQGQTGGSHQDCSHHLGSRCRSWEGSIGSGGKRSFRKKRKEKLIFEAFRKKALMHAGEETSARWTREKRRKKNNRACAIWEKSSV